MRRKVFPAVAVTLIAFGYLVGSGTLVEWPSVTALRQDATEIANGAGRASASIVAVQTQQQQDSDDWGRWVMEGTGMAGAVTAAAFEGTVATGRLMGLDVGTPAPNPDGTIPTPAVDISMAAPLIGPGLAALRPPEKDTIEIISAGSNWEGWNAYIVGNGYGVPMAVDAFEVAYSRYGSDQVVTTTTTFLVPYVLEPGGYGLMVTYSPETAALFAESGAVSYGGASVGFHEARPEDLAQRFLTTNVLPVGNGLVGVVVNDGAERYTGSLTGRGICVDAGGAVIGAVVGEFDVDLAPGGAMSFSLSPVREVVCERYIVGFTSYAP